LILKNGCSIGYTVPIGDNMKSKLTNQQKQDIIKKYQSGGYKCVDLVKEYKSSKSVISRLFKNNNIYVYKSMNQKDLNENYFEKIDNEHKAYWLGFLYADGNNFISENRVTLKLQEKDREILERFKLDLNSNRELYLEKSKNKNHQNSLKLIITSKKMSGDLIKLGCVPRKSLILKFPTEEQVPDYLIQHFIRGYFDGDGWINIQKRRDCNNYSCRFGIISTENFCKELQCVLINKLGFGGNISKDKRTPIEKSTRNLTINGNTRYLKIMDFLYSNSSIYLNRKYEKYKKSLEIISNLHQL